MVWTICAASKPRRKAIPTFKSWSFCRSTSCAWKNTNGSVWNFRWRIRLPWTRMPWKPWSNSCNTENLLANRSCSTMRCALETNLSNSVQNSFTHFAAKWGILTLSMREAAIPNDTAYWFFLFLFYPLYFVKWPKTPCFRSPSEAGCFPVRNRVFGSTQTFQILFKIRSHILQQSAVY